MREVECHLERFVRRRPDAWVFTGPLRQNYISQHWREALAQVTEAPAGRRVYDLRHHAATLTARVPGVTTKELMARIGHSSPRAALIYQHATAARDRRIAEAMDAEIASAASSSPAVASFGLHVVSRKRESGSRQVD